MQRGAEGYLNLEDRAKILYSVRLDQPQNTLDNFFRARVSGDLELFDNAIRNIRH